MGLCEKCDDRASGRLDYDLTSEKERETREGERARAKEWVRVGEGTGGTDGSERQL